MTLKMFLAPE